MGYEPVIGLEVHAQLLTDTKIFCPCKTAFGARPNTQTCPVCLGMPGVLPVANEKVVRFAISLGVATGCTIADRSVFARKNYFYPDLPKGYQISQYEEPLARNGAIEIDVDGDKKRVGILRIHMEEDAGKLIHDADRPLSRIDFNRTGVPLLEIVSEPDMRSSEEAVAYLRALRAILLYLGICDGNMEEGSFRCDANISLRPRGEEGYGTRTELKNMNSFRHIHRALDYEIRRQAALLDAGETVVQETRLWDEARQATHGMRGKEEAQDYRYFPDPDLVTITVSPAWREEIAAALPELPAAKRERFKRDYGLPDYDATVLTSSRELADYFERVLEDFPGAKKASNFVMGELMRELKRDERDISRCPVPPGGLAELLNLVEDGAITGKLAKDVFTEMYHTGKAATEIVEEKGLAVERDEDALLSVIDEVLAAHPSEAEQYRGGKTKVLGFFMGQVMKRTKGKADPRLASELIKKRLGG